MNDSQAEECGKKVNLTRFMIRRSTHPNPAAGTDKGVILHSKATGVLHLFGSFRENIFFG